MNPRELNPSMKFPLMLKKTMCAAIKHNNKTRMGFSRAYTPDMVQQSPLIQHYRIKKIKKIR